MFYDGTKKYGTFAQEIKNEFLSLWSKLVSPQRKTIRFLEYVGASPSERSYLVDFNSRFL